MWFTWMATPPGSNCPRFPIELRCASPTAAGEGGRRYGSGKPWNESTRAQGCLGNGSGKEKGGRPVHGGGPPIRHHATNMSNSTMDDACKSPSIRPSMLTQPRSRSARTARTAHQRPPTEHADHTAASPKCSGRCQPPAVNHRFQLRKAPGTPATEIKRLRFGWSVEAEGLMPMLPANDQAQRPPPETPGRLQESRTKYLNRPTARQGGGSLQRSG